MPLVLWKSAFDLNLVKYIHFVLSKRVTSLPDKSIQARDKDLKQWLVALIWRTAEGRDFRHCMSLKVPSSVPMLASLFVRLRTPPRAPQYTSIAAMFAHYWLCTPGQRESTYFAGLVRRNAGIW